MSGSPKEKLHTHGAEEVSDEREVYLRDGRKLVVSEQGSNQLVEIRNDSGMLEIRILLTAEGPVLQIEGAKLSLKATEARLREQHKNRRIDFDVIIKDGKAVLKPTIR